MDNMTMILCICAVVPMVPALYVIPDKTTRLLMVYSLLGVMICMIAAGLNEVLLGLCGGDMRYLTTCITPVTEEILKALPVLYFALVFSDDRQTLVSISYAVGLGFALLENMIILTSSISQVTVWWALVRGFGAARMHSACTAMVGRGISLIRKRRKLFYSGTLSLLILVIITHSIFNTLIQSQHREMALLMVMSMHLPQIIHLFGRIKKKEKAGTDGQESQA